MKLIGSAIRIAGVAIAFFLNYGLLFAQEKQDLPEVLARQTDAKDVIRSIFSTKTVTDTNQKHKYFTILPSAGYNPSVGISVGFTSTVGKQYGNPKTTTLSIYNANAYVSTFGLFSGELRQNVFTANDKYNIVGVIQGGKTIGLDYGLGTGRPAQSDGSFSINDFSLANNADVFYIESTYLKINERIYKQVFDHVFVGAGVVADFYTNIERQPGTLTMRPNFARIAVNGDLAFTAGTYLYQNGNNDTDKVFGDYVSIWRTDDENKFKLLLNLGIQHPEAEQEALTDFKNPDSDKRIAPSKDPFSGKRVIMATDNLFNHSLSLSTLAAYKEFLSPEGRYYFPGFEPLAGQDKIMKFIDNEAISITAQTTNAGRSTSNDLAYTYGKARIKKGEIVSDYNYVRIWEIDANHKWDILLEIFSAVENE